MDEKTKPIQTAVGIISGRDAFYLGSVSHDYAKSSVAFSGEINSGLCSASPNDNSWLPYSLTFRSVIGFRQSELDFFEGPYDSSFFTILGSSWLSNMRQRDHSGKLQQKHQHFVLFTYDDVFEVIAERFELSFGEPKSQSKA
jgi:hypothetical protein